MAIWTANHKILGNDPGC